MNIGKLVDDVSDHPVVDQIPPALAVTVYLSLHAAGVRTVQFQDWATITAFHQTLVEAAAGLFGLVFAAVAILRALGPGRRLDHLRGRLSPQATENLKAVIRALGLVTLIVILSMALDTPRGFPTLARAGAIWAATLAVVRTIRLVWYFGLVLDLSDRDAENEPGETPRRLNPSPHRSQAS